MFLSFMIQQGSKFWKGICIKYKDLILFPGISLGVFHACVFSGLYQQLLSETEKVEYK